MQHRQKEETVVMVLGCSQRVQVSKWEEIWWVYNDEMSTLSLMINDQCSSQFHFFTKSLFWGGFLVQGTLKYKAIGIGVDVTGGKFHQKVYLRVIQVSDRTFSLNHNQVSAWGQSGLGTSSQEWVRGGGCHLPAPDWHRSPAGDQIHGRRENDPEQIGFMEHVWQ